MSHFSIGRGVLCGTTNKTERLEIKPGASRQGQASFHGANVELDYSGIVQCRVDESSLECFARPVCVIIAWRRVMACAGHGCPGYAE